VNLALDFRHSPKKHTRRPPLALVSQPCAEPVCKQRFALPYDARLGDLFLLANLDGWTEHPRLPGLFCPQHAYRYPVAAIEAAPVDRPTAPFPAITEDLPYCAYCEMPIQRTAIGWAHWGESCGFTPKPIPAPLGDPADDGSQK
jgi:hypothetical protein